jgi:hypothetical protein
MSFFLGFIEKTNPIQVLIESCRFPFAKQICCGFQHESLHAIENDNEVLIRKLRLLASWVLQQPLQHGCGYTYWKYADKWSTNLVAL